MLAVLLIEMKWYKQDRSPAAASLRKEYYKPVRIADEVSLFGNGIFVMEYSYLQQGNKIISDIEVSAKLDKELYKKGMKKAFTAGEEQEQRLAFSRAKSVKRKQGAFYDITKLDLPCITILEEPEDRYRIKWYDGGLGMPRRRGGNEDCYKKGAKLAGQPNTLNETAFVLAQGQAGVLKYNYRYTSYEGQWYKCYYVYIVNEKELAKDIFIRDYNYEYNQLADLSRQRNIPLL